MSSGPSLKSDLAAALLDGSFLLDSPKASAPPADLKTVLQSRLSTYFECVDPHGNKPQECETLEDVQLLTAREALSVVTRVQKILAVQDEGVGQSQVPAIGTRDLSQLRTYLSMTFKWGTEPLLARVIQIWPLKSSDRAGSSKVADISNSSADYDNLYQLVVHLFSLLFPEGVNSRLPQTLITTSVLNQHVSHILYPAIALGWLPKQLASPGVSPIHQFRPLTMRLLAILSPSQTIASLGSILSGTHSIPLHVHKACVSLLNKQLIRPEGVRGLCEAVFGDENTSGEEVPIEKLEHVAQLLATVPVNMEPQDYYSAIIPRIVTLLQSETPSTYKKAAAFSISRFLSSDDASDKHKVASSLVYQLLHTPFLHESSRSQNESYSAASAVGSADFPSLSPSAALSTIVTLVSNTDPSPIFVTNILSSIVPSLYSLLYHLDATKTSDPVLIESLRGILVTWGKITTTEEGEDILWSILCQNEHHEWMVDLDGQIQKNIESDKHVKLSFLTPQDLQHAEEQGDMEVDANILGLYPDAVHFVQYLKNIDRSDISSDLFVKLLETYREEKFKNSSDPTRVLLYLQVIMQMQTQLSQGSTSYILRRSKDMLLFIKHILESANNTPTIGSTGKSTLNRSLQADELDDYDSDDDMPDSERSGPDDDLVETALSLLLSLLEADENLSARTDIVLNDIFSLLEPMYKDGSSSIRPLAGEARMVMTARLAAASIPSGSRGLSSKNESGQEVYQNSLKLLQDPILPVRAHGLLLLRQLVTPSKDSPESVDHALIPSILSIFLQSIQDDDSYIFLNAVQGLAAMVDAFGKDVFKGLLIEYTRDLEGLGASTLTQRDIDIRTRIGEALGIAIRRCGAALGIYVDIIIPPLFRVVRSSHLPTILRTSSLSLLAECVKVYALATLPYTEELFGAMVDLLQLESVSSDHRLDSKNTYSKEGNQEAETLNSHPTSTDSKLPTLRRAALHFISLLLRELQTQVQDASHAGPAQLPFTAKTITRLAVTLGYIASVDEDTIVRIMAREAKDQVQDLQGSLFRL